MLAPTPASPESAGMSQAAFDRVEDLRERITVDLCKIHSVLRPAHQIVPKLQPAARHGPATQGTGAEQVITLGRDGVVFETSIDDEVW